MTVCTIRNWEKQRTSPALPHMTAVIRFLGYNPLPEPQTMASRLTRYQTAHSITQKALASKLGIDPSTLARWERGGRVPTGLHRELAENLFTETTQEE